MPTTDAHDPSDPRSNPRDYTAAEAASTTALRKCVDAFKAWTKNQSAVNAAALAEARRNFKREATGAAPVRGAA
jgi:hypothetical protein